MFGKAIWYKLPEYVFENFETARLKQGQFKNFQKHHEGGFFTKVARNKHVITDSTNQTNKHNILKLISFINRQLKISERRITKKRAMTK